jgi:hypothetical protein
MGEKTKAETALAELEKHGHAHANAKHFHANAIMTGDPDKVEAAARIMGETLAARTAAGITKGEVARAAQAVLDERGEAHTETAIHPPGVLIPHPNDAAVFKEAADAVKAQKPGTRSRKQAELQYRDVTGHEWFEGEE